MKEILIELSNVFRREESLSKDTFWRLPEPIAQLVLVEIMASVEWAENLSHIKVHYEPLTAIKPTDNPVKKLQSQSMHIKINYFLNKQKFELFMGIEKKINKNICLLRNPSNFECQRKPFGALILNKKKSSEI